jgi:hypothetical protein
MNISRQKCMAVGKSYIRKLLNFVSRAFGFSTAQAAKIDSSEVELLKRAA